MENTRYFTLKLLNRTFENDGFSNIMLDNALSKSDLDSQGKSFVSALYYGVIERKITLDYIISKYATKKIDSDIKNILRMGIYQLKYMDSVPDRAGVNESVNLVHKIRKASAKSFVNAVLRNFIRDGKNIDYPKDRIKKYSVMYSVPEQLIRKLDDEYGEEYMISLLESSVTAPPVTVRMNSLKTTREDFTKLTGAVPVEKIENCFEIKGKVTGTKAFEQGLFHVQDIASQLCCMALSPASDEVVFDMCASPGGKTFTLAELMQGKGKVYSFDLYPQRVKLIKDGAERLGLENIETAVGDATVFNEKLPEADKILCDVVCSGLGVIRRKPEIKYKDLKSFEELPEIQYSILENASRYLKDGGEIVYSTCTLNRAENDDVVKKFLEKHTEFELVPFLENLGKPFGTGMVTLVPAFFGSDGFFIAKLRKNKGGKA